MEGRIILTDFTLVADYVENILNSDGCVMEEDEIGIYKCEQEINDISGRVGVIVALFSHTESDAYWALLRTDGGMLVEYKLDYENCIPF